MAEFMVEVDHEVERGSESWPAVCGAVVRESGWAMVRATTTQRSRPLLTLDTMGASNGTSQRAQVIALDCAHMLRLFRSGADLETLRRIEADLWSLRSAGTELIDATVLYRESFASGLDTTEAAARVKALLAQFERHAASFAMLVLRGPHRM